MLPVLFRVSIIMCPATSLAFLRRFFGAAGVILNGSTVEGTQLFGRGSGHVVDDGSPPSDTEIAEWVCWLADRQCVVQNIKDVITFVSPGNETLADVGADEVEGTPSGSDASSTNAAPSFIAAAIYTAYNYGREVADTLISSTATGTDAHSDSECGNHDRKSLTDIFDDTGELRPHVVLKRGFEKSGSSLTQCLICIGEYTEEAALSSDPAEADLELTPQTGCRRCEARSADRASSATRWTSVGAEDMDADDAGVAPEGDVDLDLPATLARERSAALTASASVVPFPCTSKHVFHEACLHGWLVSCGRSRRNPSCPVCREGAVTGTGAAPDGEDVITLREALRVV